MEAKQLPGEYYGLKTYEVDDEEYAVGDEAEAQKAAEMYVRESLWSFRSDFIVKFLVGHVKAIGEMRQHALGAFEKALGKMQSDMCEDANPIVEVLLSRHLETFVAEAIEADGRGDFLSSYDSEERDSDDVDGLPKGLLAYRIN